MSLREQEYELVGVGAVEPHPDNPRVGDVGAIRESIQHNGFYGACVVQRSTGFILAGNHRYKAAVAEGHEQVPVVWVDVDDVEAVRIMLADNRTAELGGYDTAKLDEMLESLGDVEGTGYSLDDLEEIERRREREAERRDKADNDEESDPLPIPDDDPPARQYGVLIICESEEDQREIYERTEAARDEGREVRLLSI